METTKSESLKNANGLLKDFKHNNPNEEISLESLSQSTGKKLGTMTSDLAHSSNEYVKSGRKFVVENPMKGVAIAAAAGAVIGSLMTLAIRKRH